MDQKFRIWICEGSNEPDEYGWRGNVCLSVIAPTFERAQALVREAHPKMTIHKMFLDRKFFDLIIDPDV